MAHMFCADQTFDRRGDPLVARLPKLSELARDRRKARAHALLHVVAAAHGRANPTYAAARLGGREMRA